MIVTTLTIQTMLKSHGFDPGPLDGIPGRLTEAAIKAFQTARGLEPDGIVGKLTLAALSNNEAEPTLNKLVPPWFEIAVSKKGLHEGKDYLAISAFLRSDQKTLGDPRQLPWCGDFVETCIALTLPRELLPANPYLARNWLKFGVACKPQLGAIAVYWRGTKTGTSGHVAFVAGNGGGANVLYILGGNQSNTVSLQPKDNSYLLGCRWPASYPIPDMLNLPTLSGGKLSINEA